MNRQNSSLIILALGALGFFHGGTEAMANFILTSSAFSSGQLIPRRYTCEGPNISPPLAWEGAPSRTQSFALISEDPDAPGGNWVHWVIFNIPSMENKLKEGVAMTPSLPNGAHQGLNDFQKVGYGGPCPPGGTHRYFFKLTALDAKLNLPSKTTKGDVEKAMQGHILAQAELMGTYHRGF